MVYLIIVHWDIKSNVANRYCSLGVQSGGDVHINKCMSIILFLLLGQDETFFLFLK